MPFQSGVSWHGSSGDVYAGGAVFSSTNAGASFTMFNRDFAFTSYVQPIPEPSALVGVLSVGTMSWCGRRRRAS